METYFKLRIIKEFIFPLLFWIPFLIFISYIFIKAKNKDENQDITEEQTENN